MLKMISEKQKQKVQVTEKQLKDQLSRIEGDFKRKEALVKEQAQQLDERRERLEIAEQRINKLEEQAKDELSQIQKLSAVANLSADQAAQELKDSLLDDAKRLLKPSLLNWKKKYHEESKQKSRRILAQAMARFAGEVSAEKNSHHDSNKGRRNEGKIIGREGRNIRALEAACGVDVIIDETPDSVVFLVLILCEERWQGSPLSGLWKTVAFILLA